MAITLNHTIVHARDPDETARFLTGILGLSPPTTLSHLTVVQVGDTSLDLMETTGPISSRHFAFLVSGRGVYFDDPNGHLLEILTRPYGSGGPDAEHPNPLFAQH